MKKNVNLPAIGSFFEIPVENGYGYAIFTNLHSKYGALFRVFQGTFPARPSDLKKVLDRKIQFVCFLPLRYIDAADFFPFLGVIPLPSKLQEFPLFRAGMVDPRTKKVETWWLWDGEKEWSIGKLNREQQAYPIRGIWNDTLLRERIQSGWTVEQDVR